jgi:hypothetical protein
MKVHDGTPIGIATAFPINLLRVAGFEHPALEGFNIREHPRSFDARTSRIRSISSFLRMLAKADGHSIWILDARNQQSVADVGDVLHLLSAGR